MSRVVEMSRIVERTDAVLGPVPDIQDPLVPRHNYWPDSPDGWRERDRVLAAEARRTDPLVVFLGDSITQGWGQAGAQEWESRFAPLPAVNLGIGGDRTQQILWRLAAGALDGLRPALVVLLIGVNNLWQDVHEFGTERVAGGIAAVVHSIRERCPDAKVLVLGILPTQSDPAHPLRGIVAEVNARSAAALPTSDGSVRIADLGTLFLEPDGTLSPQIMPDGCHLSPQGYARFAAALAPVIQEMLGDGPRGDWPKC